ncbi:MAG: hypothetical protein ABIJ57_13215, partial [Pseudomonadota bacterium]
MIKVNNFIGWICTISIIGAPVGIPMLVIGHALKALLDIRKESKTMNEGQRNSNEEIIRLLSRNLERKESVK